MPGTQESHHLPSPATAVESKKKAVERKKKKNNKGFMSWDKDWEKHYKGKTGSA